MAKHRLLFFLLAFVLVDFRAATGQIADSSHVSIAQDFRVGTTYHYQLERSNTNSRRAHLGKVTTLTDITFSILEQVGDLKACSWKYGRTSLPAIPDEQIPEASRKLLNLHQDFEVKFLIDSSGMMHQVTNLEACKSFLQRTVASLPQLAKRPVSEEEVKKVRQALEPTLATQETMLNTYCPDITLFFNLFGEVMHPDTIYFYESELPNPFGGRSFPAEVTTQISELNDTLAVITADMTISEEDLTAILTETVVKLSELGDEPVNKEEIPAFNLTTHSRFYFNHRTHMLKEAVLERKAESDGVHQVTTLRIRLKEPISHIE